MLQITLDSIPLEKFDIGGVLYHANYFHLYEQAREAFLEHVGVPYSQLVKEQKHFAVVESHMDFKQAINYGDVIELSLWADDIKKASITFHYQLHRGEELVHQGWTKHAFISVKSGKLEVKSIPQKLLKEFEKLVL